MLRMKIFFTIFLSLLLTISLSAETTKMTCKHSFQGNYSGGDVLLKYKENKFSQDKAYIFAKNEWIELCSDVETHGKIYVDDLVVSCSIYLPNWMNQRRKNFIWNFRDKELQVQTLSKLFNPQTGNQEWQSSYSVGKLFTKTWLVIKSWESDGIKYTKSSCY